MFDGGTGTYREWRRRVSAWSVYTSLEPEKQAPKMLQCLRGEAWRVTEHLKFLPGENQTLYHANGVRLLFACLNENFMATEDQEQIAACEQLLFETKRHNGETMSAYLANWRTSYRKAETRGVTLSDTLQAFLL